MASKNNLSTKIIFMVEIILLISSTLFCTVSVYRAKGAIRKAIWQRMLDIANCASGSVNGDILGSLKEEDVGSAVYDDLYRTLAVFRDNVELEYVYSIREEGDGNFIFTIDTDKNNPAGFGDSVKYTTALATAAKGTAAVDEVPYSDAWGEFYSAYSPVFDSSGNVAGIIAVDFSAEWFDDQLTSQTRSTVISYVAILLLSLLVAAVLSMLTVRPFVRMQGELFEEKVRAESANHAKTEFLANMSHEIRTPINAMLGMNEMILRAGRKAEQDAGNTDDANEALKNIGVYAEDIKKAGGNLLSIVNDILDFSRIEEGRLDLTEAPYRLDSLLGDLNSMILFKAQDKGLDFYIDVDPAIPNNLCGDEARIRQILTNILSNAVKYTEKGSVKMTVKSENTGDGKLLLKAAVSDTGIGIRREDIEKLFTRFERLEMENNSTVEGTGLGLVITKRLLDAMNGSITVESEYGKGSEFFVTIPQKIISDVPVGKFSSQYETHKTGKGAFRDSFRAPAARILAVDDTKTNLVVVVNLLKNTKMQIDTASSGADAVKMAHDTVYDVILMDQRMPHMEGSEAMHLIRESIDGASRMSPIICLTANAVTGARERYLAEGFSDYMSKPVDCNTLEKLILKYLPEEKVEYVTEDISAVADTCEDKELASLRDSGIDTRTGLKYCNGDMALYRSILADYANSTDERSENLRINLESKNWRDYAIFAHSLKSASAMIGAGGLSEKAAKLEAAAKSEDENTVRLGHDSVIEMYRSVSRAIAAAIPEALSDADDDDILEFSPEPR